MNEHATLLEYRISQAVTTLQDAKVMLEQNISARSIINRAYYAAFYSILALFLKDGIQARTSKHSGVIGIFDKEYIITGKCDKRYSQILHNLFDDRQEFDYKEFVEVSHEDAEKSVAEASELLGFVIEYIKQ